MWIQLEHPLGVGIGPGEVTRGGGTMGRREAYPG